MVSEEEEEERGRGTDLCFELGLLQLVQVFWRRRKVSAELMIQRRRARAYLTSLRRRVRGCAEREGGSSARLVFERLLPESWRTHASSCDPDRMTLACLQRGLDEILQTRTGEGSQGGRKEGELELNDARGRGERASLWKNLHWAMSRTMCR